MKVKIQFWIALFCAATPVFAQATTGWEYAKEIERKIIPPTFPNKTYNVLDFGAKGDGVFDSRPAINQAIIRCSNEGGGQVLVPAGRFFSKGTIQFKSNVDLHLSEGSEIIFSADENDYLPVVLTKWEGTELFNYSPLIYAYHVENIAITGKGTLNGQGAKNIVQWKPRQAKDVNTLRTMGQNGVPVNERLFGAGHILRPAFIEPLGCRNILIEDVKIVDATFWVIHPIYCHNVTVRRVTIDSFNFNSDGCDPESSTYILVEDCHFKTGDDGIAIKSGRDNDGWRVGQPTENMIVRNCSFETLANGVCIGSEMSGGVRNIFVENITIPITNNGIYFKTNRDRGGYIENVWVRNVKIDSIRKTAIKFDTDYSSEDTQDYRTPLRNFVIENVTCNFAQIWGVEVVGFDDLPVRNVVLRNINVKSTPQSMLLKNTEDIKLDNVVINGRKMSLDDPTIYNGTSNLRERKVKREN